MVLTFDIANAKSNASTHTNYLTKLLKNGPHFREAAHNYTGQSGLINSPGLFGSANWRSAEGHRSLSERGIIAAKPARSTPYFQSCEAARAALWGGAGPGGVTAAVVVDVARLRLRVRVVQPQQEPNADAVGGRGAVGQRDLLPGVGQLHHQPVRTTRSRKRGVRRCGHESAASAPGNDDPPDHALHRSGRIRRAFCIRIRGIGAFGCFQGELVDMHIAGGHHAPGRGDAYLWFLEIGIVKPNRTQHRTARSAFDAIDDLG